MCEGSFLHLSQETHQACVLSQIANFAPQRLDIALMKFDLVLEGLHAFKDLLIVAFVAMADGFLFREHLAGICERAFLCAEFLLQHLASRVIARALGVR